MFYDLFCNKWVDCITLKFATSLGIRYITCGTGLGGRNVWAHGHKCKWFSIKKESFFVTSFVIQKLAYKEGMLIQGSCLFIKSRTKGGGYSGEVLIQGGQLIEGIQKWTGIGWNKIKQSDMRKKSWKHSPLKIVEVPMVSDPWLYNILYKWSLLIAYIQHLIYNTSPKNWIWKMHAIHKVCTLWPSSNHKCVIFPHRNLKNHEKFYLPVFAPKWLFDCQDVTH